MRILKNIYRLLFPLLKIFLYPDSKVESYLYRTIKVGKGVQIKSGCQIKKGSIGDYSYIGTHTTMDDVESVGRYCSIAKNVHIGLPSHPIDRLSTSPVFYNPSRGYVEKKLFDDGLTNTVIENDVWIGASVCIMKGVRVGNGAIVGSGSIVTKDVPPYAIVVGSPAKIIKYRFDDETITKLLKSEWWNKDIKTLLSSRKMTKNHNEYIDKICSEV